MIRFSNYCPIARRALITLWEISGVMMTSSNGNIFRVTGPLCGQFTGPGEFPTQIQWRGALMFPLIGVWLNGWANSREAGDFETPSWSLWRQCNESSYLRDHSVSPIQASYMYSAVGIRSGAKKITFNANTKHQHRYINGCGKRFVNYEIYICFVELCIVITLLDLGWLNG